VSRKSRRDWEVRMKNMRTRLAVTSKARRTTGKMKVMMIVSSRKKTPELLSLLTLPVCQGTEEGIDIIPVLLVV